MKACLVHGRIEIKGETTDEKDFIKSLKHRYILKIRGVAAYNDDEFYFYFKDENDEIIQP